VQPTIHVYHPNYFYRKPFAVFTCVIIWALTPYVSVRTYNRLERLGYWENRIEQKRVRKMAFDYMIKTQSEREKDLIEEFADF